MNLQGMTVLVTGATGFIGGRLAERLAQETGARVRALARTPGKAAPLAAVGCEVVEGDLTDAASLERATAGCAVVFHAAAVVSERAEHAAVWAANVTGTARLVDAARAAGVARFVHVSSCAVYGSRQAFDIDETTPMRTGHTRYADSKIGAEEVIWQAFQQHGLPVTVARPSQVYGLGSPQFTLRPLAMIRKRRMVLIDGGRHLCKPIYIDNLVDGLILGATADAAVGEAFNFTDGAPVPWRDFFGAYATMAGAPQLPSISYPAAWIAALLFEGYARLRGTEASFNRAVVRSLRSNNSFSIEKALRLLGWQPRVDLAEGMGRTEAWLRAHGYLD